MMYFSFSVVYFLTLGVYLLLKKLNFFFIIFSGLFYIFIELLIVYYILNFGKLLIFYGLITCFVEFLLFNIGFAITFCRKIIKYWSFAWIALHIEIHSLYPILAIFSIPSLIIFVFLSFLLCICCKKR